jgi:hypothetical protein
VSAAEHFADFFQRVAFGGQQDKVVVHKVCGFSEKEIFVIILRFDDQFYGFLADFLGNLIDAAGKETTGVAFFGGRVPAVLDCLLEVVKEVPPVVLSPASVATCMTGWTCGARLNQEAILVTICGNGDQVKVVLTGFPFGPKPAFGPAEESNVPGGKGAVQSGSVHPALH